MLISIGKISTAFNLTPNEIHDLWRSLPTQPIIKLDRLKIDPIDREVHKEFPFVASNDIIMNINADHYAERLKWPGLRRRTVDFVLEHLLEMYDEVVQRMHESAYPLRREVKGLTRARYQEIIDRLQALSPVPAEEQTTMAPIEVALPEPIPENPPTVPAVVDSIPASGQRRLPISTLLKVIKAEADTYGLGKKYYVTTDRTIRNWLKGTSCFLHQGGTGSGSF